MKISRKLIAISVASLGMIFSIGGAIALYTTSADNASFGISAGAYAGAGGTITYKINNNTGNSSVAPSYLKSNGTGGGAGLSAAYTQVEYALALGANFSNDICAQDYVVGNLAVTVNNIPAEYQGKLSIWVVIDNYGSGTLGEHLYKNVFMNSDFAITNEAPSFSASHDVAVSSAGTQVLHVYLKYTDLGGVDLLDKDEASLGYSLSVAWTEPSNEFAHAYVVGNATTWTEDEAYAMTPNINKSGEEFEWVFNNLPGTFGTNKCKKGENWSAVDQDLDTEKSYNVYWSGANEAAAIYQEIVPAP